MGRRGRARLAVWKFASCDGCQLTLLNCEEDLLALAERLEIRWFPEASSALVKGPYDLSLVEGSISTPHDVDRIRSIRGASSTLVAIGACATAGGVQSLRNDADVTALAAAVYPEPERLEVLARSEPVARHVRVDFELNGCPVDRGQLLAATIAFIDGRRPRFPAHAVCVTCKTKAIDCVAVASDRLCLGPVTRDGCGALCPAAGRGCYGCFGPKETPNPSALVEHRRARGDRPDDLLRAFRTFTADADAFRRERERLERAVGGGK